MKKFIAISLVLLSLCFVLTACYGKNYPGATKAKYWVSEDETIMFYFPAEAGHGNAQGECYLYEKIGYKRNGESKKISENMTLIFYEKTIG